MKILSLQPFFGGSHRNFNDGWIQHSQHHWTVLALPDRSWKWRMRHAPLEFARQIDALKSQGHSWDAIVTTDMLDVATFKGITDIGPTPLTVYFHENQFAYPVKEQSRSVLHYAFTNFTTMVAANQVIFNSQFNMDSTLEGATEVLKRFPDYQPLERLDEIRNKSSVQNPGINISDNSRAATPMSPPLVITWAARWEHDKGPDQLETLLQKLVEHSIDFRINIIGQSYRHKPPVFARIKQSFKDQIEAWGFQSRQRYLEILDTTDVILSTADHEFFGLSVVEAIARGALPLLPNRLAYPEVIGTIAGPDAPRFLYNDLNDAAKKLSALADTPPETRQSIIEKCRQQYNWPIRAKALDGALINHSQRHGVSRPVTRPHN